MTVTTFTFNNPAAVVTWTVPNHTGNGSRSGTGASGGGGGGGHNELGGTAHNGAAGVVIVRYQM